MARYYFHVRRGRVSILDHEGVELADLVEAAKEAARRALEVQMEFPHGAIVVDDDHCTVLELPFEDAATALRGASQVPSFASLEE